MDKKVIMLLMIPLLLIVPAAAPVQQEGFDQLAIGEWLGQAVAGGSTKTERAGSRIAGTGWFTVDMELLVPQSGELEGSWTMDEATSRTSWDFTIRAPEGPLIELGAFMTHSAEGSINGTRSDFSLGVAHINSEITTPFDSLTTTDPLGPLQLSVSGIYCNDAFGEWILSWNSELLGESYTPTFEGDWYAVRQDLDFSEDRIREIFDNTVEFNDAVTDLYQSASFLEGVPIIPEDALWEFMETGIELQNELRNLSPCDRSLLGDGEVENFIYRLTARISALAATLLANYDVEDFPMSAVDLHNLAHLLLSAGALGEGALINTSSLENAIESDLHQILTSQGPDLNDKRSAFMTLELLRLDLPEGFDPSSIFPDWEGGE